MHNEVVGSKRTEQARSMWPSKLSHLPLCILLVKETYSDKVSVRADSPGKRPAEVSVCPQQSWPPTEGKELLTGSACKKNNSGECNTNPLFPNLHLSLNFPLKIDPKLTESLMFRVRK